MWCCVIAQALFCARGSQCVVCGEMRWEGVCEGVRRACGCVCVQLCVCSCVCMCVRVGRHEACVGGAGGRCRTAP